MPRINATARSATTSTIDGREVVTFGGCDYLALAHHAPVLEAVVRGLNTYGLSAGASRETTGNTAAHDRLEERVAEFVGLDAALLTPEGYLANMAMCQALAEDCRVTLIDERAHRSLRDAAVGAGLQVHFYRHRDAAHAKELARDMGSRPVAILTDGVFTADGGVAPVPELLDATPPAGTLVVDDCHGFCVMGPRGRGTLEHFALRDPRLVVTTTLAKGLGAYGGAVIGTRAFVAKARRAGTAYRCTTPIPPALAVAARAALDAHACEGWRLRRLRESIARVSEALAAVGVDTAAHHPHSPVFAFVLGSEESMESVAADLLARGFLVPLIEYPGGPAPRYFRLSITSAHSDDELAGLFEAMRAAMGACVA
jgi:7-keto-8-aminopelargonate synthetase-like enzyme